jgi:hypothetical protein
MAKRPTGRSSRRGARGSAGDDPGAGNPAAGRPWPPDSQAPPESPRREIRPYFYAGLDLAMATAYTVLLSLFPTRHAEHAVLLWSMVGAVGLAGAGMLWRNRWGWRAAVVGCALLLLVAVLLLVLILLSASFLAGVYGAMGRGAATIAVLAGALVIEFLGLLPAFQLKFLLTRAGRRHFAPAAAARSQGPAR